MKTAIVSFFFIALAAASCAKERTAEQPNPKTEPERAVPVISKESDVGESADSKPTSERIVSGTAVLAPDTENGEAQKGKVSITFNDDGRASGTLELADASFSLFGEKQEDNLRLWAVHIGARQSETKRGYLIGQKKGDGFEGTFAFSNSGGTQKFQGTWEASNQPSKKL